MAEDKIFLVEGEIAEKGGRKKFSKKVAAATSNFAREKTLCLFGSKNRMKRNKVFLKEIKEVQQ